MEQDKEDKNPEMKKETKREVVKKNNKEKEKHEDGNNRSTNAGDDTTTTGRYDPMNLEDDNMELAEEKATEVEAIKKTKALNWKKGKKKQERKKKKQQQEEDDDVNRNRNQNERRIKVEWGGNDLRTGKDKKWRVDPTGSKSRPSKP